MVYGLYSRKLTLLFYFCQYTDRISGSKALYSLSLIGNSLTKTEHKVFFSNISANHSNQLFCRIGICPKAMIKERLPRSFMKFRPSKTTD